MTDDDLLEKTLATFWTGAKFNCEAREQLEPMAFLFCTDADGDMATVALRLRITPGQKDSLADEIRKTAKEVKAWGVFFITETWMLDPDLPRETLLQELQRIQAGEISVSESQYRIEGLYATFESRRGTSVYFSRIDRTEGKKRLVEEKINRYVSGYSGRFANFLSDEPGH